MRYYTTEILSARQKLTPEGFLLAEGVPIARIGTMLYAAGEVPIEPLDGLIRVEREPEQVFAEATIASFEGKPITLDHPSEDVNPDNWSLLAKGIVQNVRRGFSIEDDFLIADLLVTDREAIQQVRDGLREVSCGYDADYQQIEPGRGRQMNIVGNHVALVEKGRCGSRCAIGDSAPRPTDGPCATGDSMKKVKWMDRLRAAFKNRDEAEFEKQLTTDAEAEAGEEKKKKDDEKTEDALSKVADALADLSTRVGALEAGQTAKDAFPPQEKAEKEKKDDGDEDDEEKKEKPAKDSASLVAEARDVFSRVEILSPGLHLPTVDAKADATTTRDALCLLKRKALSKAFEGGKFRDAITPFVGAKPDFKTLTCDAVASAFLGASEIVRRENNGATRVTFDGAKVASGMASSIAAINQKNRDFWTRN